MNLNRMIMLTSTYLLQNINVNCLTSDVRVLFNFDLFTVYAKRALNNRPQTLKYTIYYVVIFVVNYLLVEL